MRQALTMAEAANLYGLADARAARPRRAYIPGQPRKRVCSVCLTTGCEHLKPRDLGLQQIRLLLLLPTGEPVKLLAPQLGISEGTAKIYLSNAYRILGVSGIVQAAIWAHVHQEELKAALGE